MYKFLTREKTTVYFMGVYKIKPFDIRYVRLQMPSRLLFLNI